MHPDDRPTVPKYQKPLRLTPEQVEFIRPLLKMERSGDRQPKMILAQVRSAPYPNHGETEIAFCMVSYQTAGKILDLIESDPKTRYAPSGKMANFVDIFPQGEVIFIQKGGSLKKTKPPKFKP